MPGGFIGGMALARHKRTYRWSARSRRRVRSGMGSVRHKDVPEASSCFEAVPQFQGSLPHPTPFSYTVLLALRSLSCARSMICCPVHDLPCPPDDFQRPAGEFARPSRGLPRLAHHFPRLTRHLCCAGCGSLRLRRDLRRPPSDLKSHFCVAPCSASLYYCVGRAAGPRQADREPPPMRHRHAGPLCLRAGLCGGLLSPAHRAPDASDEGDPRHPPGSCTRSDGPRYPTVTIRPSSQDLD